MGIQVNHSKFTVFSDKTLSNKILDFTKSCVGLDNLQVAIYSFSQRAFIFENPGLKNIVGNDACRILNKNWNFWFRLIRKDERETIKSKIKEFISAPFFEPPFVLKYHLVSNSGTCIFVRHEIVLHNIGNDIWGVNYFFDITDKEKFETYLKRVPKSKELLGGSNFLISPREKEVLKLVADGFSSKQIADRLFISNHTAISHRKSLIEKFNVKNTAQLIKRAYLNMELW